LPALEAVLADAERHDVQGILIAGDHFTGGPFPAEAAHRLRSLKVDTIRGSQPSTKVAAGVISAPLQPVFGTAYVVRGNTDNRLLAYHAGEGPDAWRTSHQWAPLRSKLWSRCRAARRSV
jgi:hypothetical protein